MRELIKRKHHHRTNQTLDLDDKTPLHVSASLLVLGRSTNSLTLSTPFSQSHILHCLFHYVNTNTTTPLSLSLSLQLVMYVQVTGLPCIPSLTSPRTPLLTHRKTYRDFYLSLSDLPCSTLYALLLLLQPSSSTTLTLQVRIAV